MTEVYDRYEEMRLFDKLPPAMREQLNEHGVKSIAAWKLYWDIKSRYPNELDADIWGYIAQQIRETVSAAHQADMETACGPRSDPTDVGSLVDRAVARSAHSRSAGSID